MLVILQRSKVLPFLGLVLMMLLSGTRSAEAIASPDDYFSKATKLPQPLLLHTLYTESDGTTSNYTCSGVLVHKYYIVSAAHCIKPSSFSGSYAKYIDFKTKKPRIVSVPIEYWNIHPRYVSKTDQNDIAIVKLKKPITSLPVVSLPPQNDLLLRGFTNLIAMGWGENQNGNQVGVPAFALVDDMTDIYSNDESFNKETTLAAGRWRPVEQIFTGVCSGDSGGPLLTRFGTRTFLIGIASLGYDDCTTASPSIYTRVSAYSEWLSGHWR
jgi:secreted trypsin-like serine protease